MEIGMWKAALAGAIALVAAGVLPASAQEPARATTVASSHSDSAVEAKIAQAKSALRLRPDQERHWPRIAAAIRVWASRTAASDEGADFIQRARQRASAISARAAGAKRVMSAAMPLIRTLDPEQKQTAMMMVRAMGFSSLAAAM
jgi:hypothetical protein